MFLIETERSTSTRSVESALATIAHPASMVFANGIITSLNLVVYTDAEKIGNWYKFIWKVVGSEMDTESHFETLFFPICENL